MIAAERQRVRPGERAGSDNRNASRGVGTISRQGIDSVKSWSRSIYQVVTKIDLKHPAP
jgi:hypothetical protein